MQRAASRTDLSTAAVSGTVHTSATGVHYEPPTPPAAPADPLRAGDEVWRHHPRRRERGKPPLLVGRGWRTPDTAPTNEAPSPTTLSLEGGAPDEIGGSELDCLHLMPLIISKHRQMLSPEGASPGLATDRVKGGQQQQQQQSRPARRLPWEAAVAAAATEPSAALRAPARLFGRAWR
eukprot:COSAG01_NODE_37_length_34085_cov_64.376626_27_plen_178_part_00